MSIFSMITDLLGGADEHIQNISDTVGGLSDNEVVQNVQDKAGELGSQAEGHSGGLGDQAGGILDGLKDKLPK